MEEEELTRYIRERLEEELAFEDAFGFRPLDSPSASELKESVDKILREAKAEADYWRNKGGYKALEEHLDRIASYGWSVNIADEVALMILKSEEGDPNEQQ